MQFKITIQYDRKQCKYLVQLLPDVKGWEMFQVIGANKSIFLRSNRPMLRAKGLKQRRPQWQILAGTIHSSSSALDRIKEAIIEKMDSSNGD